MYNKQFMTIPALMKQFGLTWGDANKLAHQNNIAKKAVTGWVSSRTGRIVQVYGYCIASELNA